MFAFFRHFYLIASAKGLQPILFLTLTGAPWAQSKWTHSRLPSIAAKWSAVFPCGSRKLKSVWFFRINADNSLTSPRKTHSWIGNSSLRMATMAPAAAKLTPAGRSFSSGISSWAIVSLGILHLGTVKTKDFFFKYWLCTQWQSYGWKLTVFAHIFLKNAK